MAQYGYSNPNSAVIRVRRSDVQPGDVILGPAPRDLPLATRPRPRPQYLRRASSLDGDDFYGPGPRGRGQVARRRDPRDQYHQYDSEGSIPPRSRRPIPPRQNRQKDNRNRSGKVDSSSSSSSASSSDLGCTSDDEKLKKKAKLKKWGSIGLAGVATIHAVAGVHSTIEKRKKNREELQEGEISEHEAERRRNKGRWRNAANLGIAAVWIKGAVDEIKEYREATKEHQETIEKSEERHLKRIERAKAIKKGEYKGHHVLDEDERRKYLRDGGEDDDR
jgi:hypothetical protein